MCGETRYFKDLSCIEPNCPGGHCQETVNAHGAICGELKCPGGHCQEKINAYGALCGKVQCAGKHCQETINAEGAICGRAGCPGMHCRGIINQYGVMCGRSGCMGRHCQGRINRLGRWCGSTGCPVSMNPSSGLCRSLTNALEHVRVPLTLQHIIVDYLWQLLYKMQYLIIKLAFNDFCVHLTCSWYSWQLWHFSVFHKQDTQLTRTPETRQLQT